MHMQGIKVIVNNPTPKKNDKVDTFEDTMLLMSICKHKMELAKYEKKEKKIMELAMEQKRKNGKTNAVTYKL